MTKIILKLLMDELGIFLPYFVILIYVLTLVVTSWCLMMPVEVKALATGHVCYNSVFFT